MPEIVQVEMATFRELFDERDRDEIVGALQARLGILEARVRKLNKSDRVTDATTQLDRHEARVEYLNDLIKRVCAECD